MVPLPAAGCAGESEAGLRGIWAAASALAPSLIFIDEIDALAPARGGGGHGAGSSASADMSSRLVTVLLTLMDGVQQGPGQGGQQAQASASSAPAAGGVVVVAATNRPDALDAALRRPGRLEREVEVGAPGPAARADMLRTRCAPAGSRHRW